jgi:TadE-like protein
MRRRQRGATAMEMALVMTFFIIPMMFGLIDFSRWFGAVIAANEATRLGARIAVVCDNPAIGPAALSAGIKARMRTLLPLTVTDNNIDIQYLSLNCGAGEVCGVSVALKNAPSGANPEPHIDAIAGALPFIPSTMPIPKFRTVLTRESLQTTIGTSSNPLCSP